MAVVVAGVVVTLGVLGSELGSGGLLGGSVDVLDLGLTEDAKISISMHYKPHIRGVSCLHPGVARRRLVDIRVVDDEEDLLEE